MIPEAKERAPIGAGFAAVIGYAVAAGLSAISQPSFLAVPAGAR